MSRPKASSSAVGAFCRGYQARGQSGHGHGPMVAGCYHRAMSPPVLDGPFNVSQLRAAGPASLVLESLQAPGLRVLVHGYRGPSLPARLTDPRLEEAGAGATGHAWRLDSPEGGFEFQALSIERHEALPAFFEPMLAGFALRPRDRTVVRILLRMLRMPGGAWLMRAWHASRR